MQNPGFNVECNDNNKARWGYCVNCASQSCQLATGNDADASIGIGLKGQDTTTEMGAGWTGYFASGAGTCSSDSETFKRVWVSVSNATVPGKNIKLFCANQISLNYLNHVCLCVINFYSPYRCTYIC